MNAIVVGQRGALRDGLVALLYTMPDIHGGGYDSISWDLAPGDCLVFDFRTIHAGGRERATGTMRRMTFRLGGEDVRFEPRGEWTREISDHLVGQGQHPGQPLDNPLTPVIYARGPSQDS